MVQVTRTVETHLKTCGLNQKLSSVLKSQQLTMGANSLVNFQLKIIDYLTIESSKIQSEQTILATSDVIESLFGKYKQFSSRCPFKQIGQMILSLSLSTMKLTGSVVKLALETVRYLDLEAWSDQVFGQSMLSKEEPCLMPQITTRKLHENFWASFSQSQHPYLCSHYSTLLRHLRYLH